MDYLELDETTRKALRTFEYIQNTEFVGVPRGDILAEDSIPCNCSYTEGVDEEWKACGKHSECINRCVLVECHPLTCPTGRACKNRRFQKKEYARIKVIEAGDKGFGVEAAEDIQEGSFVIEYTGEMVERKKFVKRTYEYGQQKIKHHYFMEVDPYQIIDATRKGNVARFINHSCKPNCELQRWMVNGQFRMGIFTTRKIFRGEELTFDYKFERLEGTTPQICFCGEEVCKGVIGVERKQKENKIFEYIGGDGEHEVISDSESDEGQTVKKADVYNKSKVIDSGEDSESDAYVDSEGSGDEQYPTHGHRTKGLQTHEDMLKLVQLMMQAQIKKSHIRLITGKLLETAKNKRLLSFFLSHHGLRILRFWLLENLNDETIVIPILQCIKALPIKTRNTVEDNKIEDAMVACKKSRDEFISELAKNILESWKKLKLVYKIPKRTNTTTNDRDGDTGSTNANSERSKSATPSTPFTDQQTSANINANTNSSYSDSYLNTTNGRDATLNNGTQNGWDNGGNADTNSSNAASGWGDEPNVNSTSSGWGAEPTTKTPAENVSSGWGDGISTRTSHKSSGWGADPTTKAPVESVPSGWGDDISTRTSHKSSGWGAESTTKAPAESVSSGWGSGPTINAPTENTSSRWGDGISTRTSHKSSRWGAEPTTNAPAENASSGWGTEPTTKAPAESVSSGWGSGPTTNAPAENASSGWGDGIGTKTSHEPTGWGDSGNDAANSTSGGWGADVNIDTKSNGWGVDSSLDNPTNSASQGWGADSYSSSTNINSSSTATKNTHSSRPYNSHSYNNDDNNYNNSNNNKKRYSNNNGYSSSFSKRQSPSDRSFYSNTDKRPRFGDGDGYNRNSENGKYDKNSTINSDKNNSYNDNPYSSWGTADPVRSPNDAWGAFSPSSSSRNDPNNTDTTRSRPHAFHTQNHTDLLPGWSSAVSEDGKTYYYNLFTNQTQWDPPLKSTTSASPAPTPNNSNNSGTAKSKPKSKSVKFSAGIPSPTSNSTQKKVSRSHDHASIAKKKGGTTAVLSEADQKNIEKQYTSALGPLIVKLLSRQQHVQQFNLDKQVFKHEARKLTHILIEKEKKSHSSKPGTNPDPNLFSKLTDHKRKKIEQFVVSYVEKLKSHHQSQSQKQSPEQSQVKQLENPQTQE